MRDDHLQMPVDSRELQPRTNGRGGRPRTPTPPTDAPPPAAASLLTSPLKVHPAKPPELDREVTRIRSLPVQQFSFDDELQRLNLRPTRHLADPLGDDLYTPHHLAAERREKRNKNIERELLHHNAVKIGNDLDNLRSPDWIKLIGLSAALVARCSKQELEQRKEALVSHLETTLEKFRAWNKGEKRKRHHRSSPSPPSSSRETDDCPDENDRLEGGGGGGEPETSHDESEGHKSTMRRGKKPKPLAAKPSHTATAASATTTATTTTTTTATTAAATTA